MAPPHKKHKTNSNNISISYNSILSNITNVSSQLESLPNSPIELIIQLELLHKSLEEFTLNNNNKDSENGIENDEFNLKKWKDKIDQEGSFFWNKSVAAKCSINQLNQGSWESLYAKLRLVAFDLISIGTVEPITLESHINLLNLGTKAAMAFINLSDTDTATKLLEICAQHASFINPSNPSSHSTSTSQSIKVLLSYYSTRINFLTIPGRKETNLGIARYLMNKCKTLDLVNGKEIESLADLGKGVGDRLLTFMDEPNADEAVEVVEEEKGTRAAIAVEWLLEAIKLVENRESKISKLLQISILKSLSVAYINLWPLKSGWVKAESVVSELLKLESSAKVHRKLIKLIISRNGSDSEIIEAFVEAASMDSMTEVDGSRLLAEIHRLPDARRSLKFSILNSLLEVILRKLSTIRNSNSLGRDELEAFLVQIVYAIVFSLTSKDTERLEEVYDKISVVLPGFALPTNAAFVLTTFSWRQGDKAHASSSLLQAATWYLLSTHSILSILSTKTWAKAFRKAALCFSEIGMFEKAEEVMRREEGGKASKAARSVFVRFYNFTLMKEMEKASSTLDLLISAPDFNLHMLLWAAKTAHDSGSKPLLRAVLAKLLDVCQGRSVVVINVDTMVLVRCLIRLHVAALDSPEEDTSETGIALGKHFETALQLAESLAEKGTETESILQNITWLYQTGYNLCARFTGEWDQSILIQLYNVVASLLELESKLSSKINPESISKLWTCRFASMSSKFFNVRLLDSQIERIEGYRELLPDITNMRISLGDTRSKFPNIEKGEVMEKAILGMEIESLSALDDWDSVARLVEEIARSERKVPISIFKAIAERVVSSENCPSDIVYLVLKRILDILSSRKDLISANLASWLRVIITFLLQRGDFDQAYLYIQNALTLTKSQSAMYSAEELQWLCATIWDQGLDLYSANAIKKAREWCSIAIEFAETYDRTLFVQLKNYNEGLESQYPLEVD